MYSDPEEQVITDPDLDSTWAFVKPLKNIYYTGGGGEKDRRTLHCKKNVLVSRPQPGCH
jgi:hypothetical protein